MVCLFACLVLFVCLAWLGCAVLGLAVLGLAWLGLAGLGLAGLGLAWLCSKMLKNHWCYYVFAQTCRVTIGFIVFSLNNVENTMVLFCFRSNC